MVLVVEPNQRIGHSTTLQELYELNPTLLEQAKRFAKIPPRTVQPEGVLYIRQKEDVVTFNGDKLSNDDKVIAVGTQVRNLTSNCHVVILHHAASGVTAMAHYDEYVRERRLQKLVTNFGTTKATTILATIGNGRSRMTTAPEVTSRRKSPTRS